MSDATNGRLVIISGPSGAGKTTVVRQLIEQSPLPLLLSVSATTRAPRPGEQDGVDYHFLTPETFEARRRAGDFLECFEVFGPGDWYGTLQKEVTSGLAQGKWVILEIDVQGTLSVCEEYPEAITIFIRPATMEELERRLRGRGTESDETLQRRLGVARRELEYADSYSHVVINDSVEQSVREICEILENCGA
jgi:guanylate kinase